jgi:hypothetical protein
MTLTLAVGNYSPGLYVLGEGRHLLLTDKTSLRLTSQGVLRLPAQEYPARIRVKMPAKKRWFKILNTNPSDRRTFLGRVYAKKTGWCIQLTGCGHLQLVMIDIMVF